MRIIESKNIDRIYPLVLKAFPNEESVVDLTNDLLKDASAEPILSLVAEIDKEYVGHILFTRAGFKTVTEAPNMYILAPLAVIPKHQKKGIGGALIREGLRILKDRGVELVFVLGHIDYYPRYGFINDAKQFGYPAPFVIPEEVKDAWMLQSLINGVLPEAKGTIQCCEAMNKEEYWRE